MSNIQTRQHITINGKKYDADNGQLISDFISHPKPETLPTFAEPKVEIAPIKKAIAAEPAVTSPAKKIHVSHQSVAAHKVHTRTVRSHTLARQYVSKPARTKSQIKEISSPATHEHGVSPAHSAKTEHFNHIPTERLHHAQTVSTHPRVSKFDTSVAHSFESIIQTITEVPMQQVPQKLAEVPLVEQVTDEIKRFEQQVQGATSHLAAPFEKRQKNNLHHRTAKKLQISPRALTVSVSLLTIVFVGSFVVYQNIPGIAVKVAASRAGVPASMPSYAPTGFAFAGPVQYKSGQITIGYHSTTDDRSYQLYQQKTTWDSATLANVGLAAEGTGFNTYMVKGQAIYVYNGTSATWVNNGVRYTIEGDSNLSTDQLLRIASSI